MKTKLILAISFVVLSISATAQENYGYYGKKNFVELTSSSYLPLVYALTNRHGGAKLSPSGNSLYSYNDWFNTGVRMSIGRALESNFGIAIEVGYERFTLTDNVLYGMVIDDYTYVSDHESLVTNSFLFLPRCEISGRNGLLPNGLVHQIGVGMTINSIAKKNYLIEYNNGTISGGPNGADEDQEMLFKNQNTSIKFIQLMYGLKMRAPVGKSMMINYGFRYTLDFGITPFDFGLAPGGISGYAAHEIREYLFRNLIAFDLGLTLPF